jgi:hypothetical protein
MGALRWSSRLDPGQLLRHGAPGGGRLHAAQGGAAPRHRLAYDVEREIEVLRKGQAVPAQSLIAPHLSGYDPAWKSEMSEHDPARAKALLDLLRLRRPRRRRLARPARRPAAGAGVLGPARPAERASCRSCGRRRMDAHRRAHRVQDRQVARAAQGQPCRQADDVGRGLERHQPDGGLPSWTWPTAPTRASPTTPASTCRPSTRCTSAAPTCPTAPSARR